MNNNSNNTVNDLDPCLDEQELRAYASGEDTGVRERSVVRSHLNVCETCRERLEQVTNEPDSLDNLIKRSVKIFRDRQEQMREATKRGPVPGTIWRVKPNPEARDELIGPLVLVLDSDKATEGQLLSVVEVSEAIDQALDSDILLLPQGSLMSFPTIIGTENAFRMGKEWLHSFAGELADSLWKRVLVLMSERKQIQHEALQVAGTDPRVDFLQASVRKCGYLFADKEAAFRRADIVASNHAYSAAKSQLKGDRFGADENLMSVSNRLKSLISLISARAKRHLDAYTCHLTLIEEISREHYHHESQNYRIGDSIRLCVTSPADGYLTIFHHNEQGQSSLVLPNYYEKDAFVEDGMEKSVDCEVKGPVGKQFFRAIWTSQQWLDPSRLVLDVPDAFSANQREIEMFLAAISGLGVDEFDEGLWEFMVTDRTVGEERPR